MNNHTRIKQLQAIPCTQHVCYTHAAVTPFAWCGMHSCADMRTGAKHCQRACVRWAYLAGRCCLHLVHVRWLDPFGGRSIRVDIACT